MARYKVDSDSEYEFLQNVRKLEEEDAKTRAALAGGPAPRRTSSGTASQADVDALNREEERYKEQMSGGKYVSRETYNDILSQLASENENYKAQIASLSKKGGGRKKAAPKREQPAASELPRSPTVATPDRDWFTAMREAQLAREGAFATRDRISGEIAAMNSRGIAPPLRPASPPATARPGTQLAQPMTDGLEALGIRMQKAMEDRAREKERQRQQYLNAGRGLPPDWVKE